jgi:hypothetical protein
LEGTYSQTVFTKTWKIKTKIEKKTTAPGFLEVRHHVPEKNVMNYGMAD